jgi:hypothetical protein
VGVASAGAEGFVSAPTDAASERRVEIRPAKPGVVEAKHEARGDLMRRGDVDATLSFQGIESRIA